MELNKIYNEDCLKTMSRMPENFVDLTVTSPPYDKLREYNGYLFEFENVACELYRITKQGGVLVWVVGDSTINGSETGTSFNQALYFKKTGFFLHDTMIYLKDGFAFPEATRYQPIFEYMFVLSKGKPKTFNPIKRKNIYGAITELEHERQKDGTVSANKMRYQLEDGNLGNVWLYGTGYMKSCKDKIAYKHPAQFPEQLAADHIYSWSNETDLVYDCFGGSGTTAKMAHTYKRNWIISEISPEYCEIAQKRIDPYLKQTALF